MIFSLYTQPLPATSPLVQKEKKMSLFNAKHFTLENGLQIIMIKQISQAVAVGVLYRVGTADDPEGLTGISHFLEHMMFRGTKTYPSDVFKNKIASMGGYVNAFTSFDITFYETRVPLPALEEILHMEADRMVNLEYNQSDIDAELKAVKEEYSMRISGSSSGPVEEILYRNMYLYHPYGVLPIGYPQHINAYTRDNAFAWYKKWYHPNNATLIIAGDIEFEPTLEMVKKHFGDLKKADLPERKRVTEPELPDTTRYIKQANDRFASVTVEMHYPSPNRSYAHSLATYLLGGDSLSLFYEYFVRQENKGIQSTGWSYHTSLDSPNMTTLYFSVSPFVNVQEVVFDAYKGYKKQLLSTYIDSPAFKEKFETAKKRIIANMIHDTDGTENATHAFIMTGYGYSFDEINQGAEKIEAITLEDVKAEIKKLLTQTPKVVFIGVPKNTETPELYRVVMD